MKKISIFGFTGSIGSQALNIIEQKPENFEIDVFVCNKNIAKAISLINLHKPKNVFIFNPNARSTIIEECSISSILFLVEFSKFLKKCFSL